MAIISQGPKKVTHIKVSWSEKNQHSASARLDALYTDKCHIISVAYTVASLLDK